MSILPQTRHNLPAQPTSFIGRESEIAEIVALLTDPACRLLTLTGLGGIGKTRLALQAAHNTAGHFSNGVFLVPLQPLQTASQVLSAVIEALNLQTSRDPHAELLNWLEDKRLLLVMDNFEHLLDGANIVTDILNAAPRVKLLVTSRDPLRLQEEWVRQVRGLDYPDDATGQFRSGYSAMQLFIERARQKRGDLRPEKEHAHIIRICQLVEGMPLALELAAGWVGTLSCAEIAAELEYNTALLAARAHNISPRHQSMQAVFDHSWRLLTEREQAVMRRFTVFRGGCTRAAAEQVTGADLPLLAGLVEKTLLRHDPDTGRYDIHELVRQYAGEQLKASGEMEAINRKHCNYCLQLAKQVEANAFGHGQIMWFDLMEVEIDNLRAALTWSLKTETSLELSGSLGWFFGERAYWSEGLDWMERALAANPNAPVSLRAKVFHSAAALAGLLGDFPRVSDLCEQALTLARATNDRWNIAWALCHLIWEESDQTPAWLEESLSLFRELDDAMGMAHTLVRRSWIARGQGDYAYTRRLLDEAASYARKAGDKGTMAWVSYGMGKISWTQDHNPELARTHFQTSLSLFRETRMLTGVNNSLLVLSQLELVMGNMKQAQKYVEEALILLWQTTPSSAFVPGALQMLISIAKARGQIERATTLLGVVNSGHWVEGFVFDSEIDLNSDEEDLRAQLGDAVFAETWTAGKAMTREQAIAYALERSTVTAQDADRMDVVASVNQSLPDSLSSRELEVLALIADGLTNHEIADQLFVGVSTIKKHIQHIYAKLGTKNRTSAVLRARELKLLP